MPKLFVCKRPEFMVEQMWSWKCAVHCLIPIGQLPGLFQHIDRNVAYSPDMQLLILLKLLGCNCIFSGSVTASPWQQVT